MLYDKEFPRSSFCRVLLSIWKLAKKIMFNTLIILFSTPDYFNDKFHSNDPHNNISNKKTFLHDFLVILKQMLKKFHIMQ